MSEYYVCNADEIPDRGRRVVQCGEYEIGIFRLGGELVAWHNRCAHRGGPVCQARRRQTLKEAAMDSIARRNAEPLKVQEVDVHTDTRDLLAQSTSCW